MVRKLKHHEQKLLKKFDFLNWKSENTVHALKVMGKFHISQYEYTEYNKISRQIREIAKRIHDLEQGDFRNQCTRALLTKLYDLGLIPHKRSLELADKITASTLCRRRLAMVLMRCNMAPTANAAITFISHGHVRVGTESVRDPAFLVPRALEDYITWSNKSKIKETIGRYNDEPVDSV